MDVPPISTKCTDAYTDEFNLANSALKDISLGEEYSISGATNHYQQDADALALKMLGGILKFEGLEIPIVLDYDQPDTIYQFPMSYDPQTVFNTESGYGFRVENQDFTIEYSATSMRSNVVDGWGTLNLPIGSFNVIKHTSILETSFQYVINGEPITIPSVKFITYSWFAKEFDIPLLTASGTIVNETPIITTIEYIDTERCFDPSALFAYVPTNYDVETGSAVVPFINISVNADSYSWDFGDGSSSTDKNPSHTYSCPGTYNVILTAERTCGEMISDDFELPIVVTDLDNRFKSSIEASICDGESYQLLGGTETYTESGIYQEIFATQAGCDSTVTLVLSVLETSSGEDVVEVCKSYDWEGDTYTASGEYRKTLTGMNGCDSVATLTLTILEPISGEAEVASYESYEWEGDTYLVSGDYEKTLMSKDGCDSTATLILTILKETSGEVEVTSCESYQWEGDTYMESGEYEKILVNQVGCDSTVTLLLTILEETSGELEIASCDVYEWEGNTYTDSGTYRETLINQAGCDSLAILVLEIIDSPVARVEVSGATISTYFDEDFTYQWFSCETQEPISSQTSNTFTVVESGEYHVEVTNAGLCTTNSSCALAEVPLSVVSSISSLQFYPNPTRDGFLYIDGVSQNTNYQLMDASGKVIQKGILDQYGSLEIKGEKGLYFIQIVNDYGETVQRKVVKQ